MADPVIKNDVHLVQFFGFGGLQPGERDKYDCVLDHYVGGGVFATAWPLPDPASPQKSSLWVGQNESYFSLYGDGHYRTQFWVQNTGDSGISAYMMVITTIA